MGCACNKKADEQHVWVSDPDASGATTTKTYDSEMVAKAKVLRAGGSYTTQKVG